MALKTIVENLDGVSSEFREHYTASKDGKSHVLQLDGDPPGYVKAERLAEFREQNVKLQKTVSELEPLKTKYDGIDPDAARAALAKVGELDAVKSELATEK